MPVWGFICPPYPHEQHAAGATLASIPPHFSLALLPHSEVLLQSQETEHVITSVEHFLKI